MNRIIFYILFIASLAIKDALAFTAFEDQRTQIDTQKRLIEESLNGSAFSNRIYLDIKSSDFYDATSSSNEMIRTDAVVDFSSNFYYNQNWFSYFNFRIEQEGVRSNEFRTIQVTPVNGPDQFLSDHYGTIRQFLVGYDSENFKIFTGKFRPNFGYAWTLGRGAYSDYLASSYMQNNRVGLGGELKYGNAKNSGRYNLGISFYKYDKKYLDNSVLSSYRNVVNSDAAPSASNSLDSFTINLDIDFDFKGGKDLFYRFAFSKQNIGDALMLTKYGNNNLFEDQESYSMAMNYKFMLNNNLEFDNLIEYKDGEFLEGVSLSRKDNVLTVNLIAQFMSKWSIGTTYSNRRISSVSGLSVRDSISEVSLGYDFKKNKFFDGFQLQFGYAKLKTKTLQQQLLPNNKDSVFALIRYVKDI